MAVLNESASNQFHRPVRNDWMVFSQDCALQKRLKFFFFVTIRLIHWLQLWCEECFK